MRKISFITIAVMLMVSMLSATDYIHYRLGKKYKEQGEYELATDELQKVISVYPDHYNAYYLLGEISRIQGDRANAEAHFLNALKYNPGWRSAYRKLAKIYEDDGDYDRAIQMLQKAQRGAPEDEKVVITDDLNRVSGRIQENKGPDPDSLAKVQKEAAAKKKNVKPVSKTPSAAARAELDKAIRSYQETVRAGSANFNKAIAHIRKALTLHPGYPAAYYYAGLIRRRLNQPEMAKVNFEKAVSDPKLGYNAHFYLAKIYGEEGKYKEAIKEYELYRSKTEYEPGRREALSMIQQYQQVLEKKAADTVDIAEVNRQEIEEELKQLPPQFDVSELQVRIAPLLTMVIADTATNEGQAMLGAVKKFRDAQYDQAIDEFRKVLEKYPRGNVAGMTLYDIGISYMKLHDWDGAIDKFSQYRERFPEGELAPNALFLKAVAQFEMKKNSIAERLFQTYIRENRSGKWVGKSYEKLGDIYRDEDQLKRAVEAYELAVKHGVTSDDKIFAAFKKGEVLIDLKNMGAAIKSFRYAIETGEKSSVFTRVPDSYYRIADHYYRQKEYEKSRDEYLRATRLYPSYQDTPWGLFQIGNIAKNLNDYDRAIAAYDTLIARYPEDYWASQAEWKRKDAVWQYEYGTE